MKLEYGIDANTNGTLDINEINALLTKYICNGATGTIGQQGPIGSTGPAGANGNSGNNGVDGKNSLVKTTNEASGINCSTGGMKLEYGLDANNNGTLDALEINATLTKFVCNGTVGSTGANGSQGGQGQSGSNGTNGLNALIKTSTETAGSNCTNGGTKIEAGLDANGNSILDAVEVNAGQTQYVCNGALGTSSNLYHGSVSSSSNGSWVVPIGINEVNIVFNGTIGGRGGHASGPYNGFSGGLGGNSAFFSVTLKVSTGDIIYYLIGSNGTSGIDKNVGWTGNYNYGGAGTNGVNSTLSIGNELILTLTGGSGGSGACGGCNNTGGTGINGSPGIDGSLILNNFNDTGILHYSNVNILNLPSANILIRY